MATCNHKYLPNKLTIKILAERNDLIMPDQPQHNVLKSAIEALIRRQYGDYLMTLQEAVGASNGVVRLSSQSSPVAEELVDIGPLISGDADKEAKEIDKMFYLSKIFEGRSDAYRKFKIIAQRLQMLTHLHTTIQGIFTNTLQELLPKGVSELVAQDFSTKLQKAWASDLHDFLVPDQKVKDTASEIIAHQDNQSEALDAYLAMGNSEAFKHTPAVTLARAREALFENIRRAVVLPSLPNRD